MAKIFFLISLALLIGIVLSIPSKSDKSKSNEDAVRHSSNRKHKHSKNKNNERHSKHKHDEINRHDEDESIIHEHSRVLNRASHEHHHKHSNKNGGRHQKHSKHASRESPVSHKETKHQKAVEDLVDNDDDDWNFENTTFIDTRRILYSKTTPKGKRPYMVYLQLTKESAKAHKYRGWLCGGVIVHKYYVLTSAACVEDADHFYVVSGTRKFVDSFDYKNDDCVCKNRRKVVWKCIPKNYKFDFQDSIKWSSNDIAIVKVHKPFKFGLVETGCEFGVAPICYNNISRDLEKPGTKGWIAGWGSGSNFREGVYRRAATPHIPDNAKCLQEAKVCIMDNEQCAKKWSQRFRSIITQYMICTKDVMKRLSEICDKRYANCTDIERRQAALVGSNTTHDDPNAVEEIDLGRHLRHPNDYTARRSSSGGFCENDHGGPLIVKYQNKDRVIGVISACKIDPKTHGCHGPFLYTSVFKNRQFISCAIYKDTEETCRRVFRTGITHEEWNVDWDSVKEDDDDTNVNQAEKKDASDSSSSSSSNSVEALRAAHSKIDVKNNKKASASSSDSSETAEERQGNKKSASEEIPNKFAKKSKKESASVSSDSSSNSSEEKKEGKKIRRDLKDVFYESSRDENVNEPGSTE